MDLDAAPVKARRRYDSSGRQDRARRSRAHVLQTAEEMFLRNGYAGTTVATLATAAGVSAETIYKSFGGKPGMIRAIQRSGLAGAGPVPAPDRSDEISASNLAPRAILRHWATLTTEVAPRVAPITLLVRSAAATDSDMATLLADINDERLDRMLHNAERLNSRGHLRAGLPVDRAAEIMFAYTAPELYEILMIQRSWAISDYGDFIYRGLVAELINP
jgi:AcrR family transcriptional regulator